MDRQDAIRARIKKRQADLGLADTGKVYQDAGLGSTTVRNFIDGMTRSMTVETAEKLAPVLKVSAQWLLYGDTAEFIDLLERVPPNRKGLVRGYLQRIVDEAEEG